MVAVEMEVMAKKFDRYGWDRDRGSAVHDRLVSDWIDALQDFPLSEIRAACREWVRREPRRMPNEGDIRKLIQDARRHAVARHKATMPAQSQKPQQRVTPEAAASIMAEIGFKPKRMTGGVKHGGS